MVKNGSKSVNVPQTRRIFLDLDVTIADKAEEKAKQLRVPKKRYIEALIERDCARRGK